MAQRVKYLERQVLTADDLNQEQAYLLDLHRRHNLANHDWGILRDLHFYLQENQLWLAQGMAVDGYGRELFVSEPFPIQRELFAAFYPDLAQKDAVIDLWLRYAREANEPRQQNTDVCDPHEKSRSLEEARLCATRPPRDAEGNPKSIDSRRPSGVAVDDLDFPPFREQPDDPARSWPVYLGRLQWNEAKGHAMFDEGVRVPYANLVGTLLRSASRQPAPGDPKALTTPPPVDRAQVEMAPALSGRPPFAVYCSDPKGNLIRRLSVLSAGNNQLKGQTIVVSALTEEERMRLQPDANEKGNLSTLRIGKSATLFTESMIRHPSRLAAKIMAGAFPLESDARKVTHTSVETLFQRPLDTEEQKKDLRQSLADLLNDLASGESLATPARLQNLRLSRDTWELIRSKPTGRESVPLNARIIAEVFSSELNGNAILEAGKAMEVGQLGLPETKKAMPWSLYRVEKQEGEGPARSVLRFETFDPGDKDDPTLYQFVIGKFEEDQAFTPCMSVDAGCNVTIHGGLIVNGELLQSPVQADPDDPRFVEQLVQGWDQGVSAALDASLAASTSLKATIANMSAFSNQTSWSYDLTIQNMTQTTVTNIRVLDTFSIDSGGGTTRPMAQISSLQPDESKKITITHTLPAASPLPASGRLYVIASVQGRLPNNITAYATARGDTAIVPPVT